MGQMTQPDLWNKFGMIHPTSRCQPVGPSRLPLGESPTDELQSPWCFNSQHLYKTSHFSVVKSAQTSTDLPSIDHLLTFLGQSRDLCGIFRRAQGEDILKILGHGRLWGSHAAPWSSRSCQCSSIIARTSIYFIIFLLVLYLKNSSNSCIVDSLYPLVKIQKTMERSTIVHGKTHYFNGHFQ